MKNKSKTFLILSIIFSMLVFGIWGITTLNYLKFQDDKWQTIECWNDNTTIEYTVQYSKNRMVRYECSDCEYDCLNITKMYLDYRVRDCETKTTQVCKEGRDCKFYKEVPLSDGTKIYNVTTCKECRNSLTKKPMRCNLPTLKEMVG